VVTPLPVRPLPTASPRPWACASMTWSWPAAAGAPPRGGRWGIGCRAWAPPSTPTASATTPDTSTTTRTACSEVRGPGGAAGMGVAARWACRGARQRAGGWVGWGGRVDTPPQWGPGRCCYTGLGADPSIQAADTFQAVQAKGIGYALSSAAELKTVRVRVLGGGRSAQRRARSLSAPTHRPGTGAGRVDRRGRLWVRIAGRGSRHGHRTGPRLLWQGPALPAGGHAAVAQQLVGQVGGCGSGGSACRGPIYVCVAGGGVSQPRPQPTSGGCAWPAGECCLCTRAACWACMTSWTSCSRWWRRWGRRTGCLWRAGDAASSRQPVSRPQGRGCRGAAGVRSAGQCSQVSCAARQLAPPSPPSS